MSRRRLLAGLVAAVLLQVACEPDPARSVTIPRAFDAGPRAAAPSAPASRLQWNAALCPPPPESAAGPSSLAGSGGCAFQQRGGANCILTDDDLLMEITRPMPNNGLFMLYVSVENFLKGRENDDAEVVVGVETPQGLYRWATDAARLTNAPDERAVTIAGAHLPSVPPMRAPELVVSGTFVCGSVDQER